MFLILASSFIVAFAQKPVAREVAPENRGNSLAARVVYFTDALEDRPSAQGCIVLYGSKAKIGINKKNITAKLRELQFDVSRITFVDVGRVKEGIKFYIVPAGAAQPDL